MDGRHGEECRRLSDKAAVNVTGSTADLHLKEGRWESFMHAIGLFSQDFMADGREQDVAQEREEL